MKYVITVAKWRIRRISSLEHMLLMCEIPWHYTGDTDMKKNVTSTLQKLEPNWKQTCRQNHSNLISETLKAAAHH